MDERSDSTRDPEDADDGSQLVGLISDTHGLLRPRVFEVFDGVSHILHAGDIGGPAILEDLSAIAPVTAVWGNMDGPEVRSLTAEWQELEFGGIRIVMIHGHQIADPRRLTGRFPDAGVIVHGHTHLPAHQKVDGKLILNPGSAGPRRAGKPVTVALARLGEAGVSVRHLHL